MSTIGTYKVDAHKLSRATNIVLFMLEEYGGYSPEDLELGLPNIELHFAPNCVYVSATLGENQLDAEGRERPMHINFRIEAICADGYAPRGVTTLTVPAFDLLASLRNGSGSADNGVLDGDVVLALQPNDGMYPEREGTHILEIIPAHTFRPRTIPVRSVEENKVDLRTLAVPKAKGTLPLDMTELLNFGRVARDEDGILLDPQRGVLLAQHASGWMVNRFDVLGEDGEELELSLEQPVVLSPRIATLIGLLQMGEAKAAVEEARIENARRRAMARIAALAAARDVAREEVSKIIHEAAGRLRIMQAQRTQSLVEARKNRVEGDAEVAFAASLLQDISEDAAKYVIYTAARLLAESGHARDADTVRSYMERLSERTDEEHVRSLAALLHFMPEDVRQDPSFAVVVGNGVMLAALAELRGVDESEVRMDSDSVTSFDHASAIHQLVGRNEFIRVVDAAVEAARYSPHKHLWGRQVIHYLQGEDALLELFAGIEELEEPDIGAVSISNYISQKWLSEATERAKGFVTLDPKGRILYISDDVYVSDAAYQRDPQKFAAKRVGNAELRLNLDKMLDLVEEESDQWSIDVSASDFSFVVDRVARLGHSGKSGAVAMGIVRWSPKGRGDVAGRLDDVSVRDHTQTVEGYRIPGLSKSDEYSEHGVLRVLGLGDDEKRVQFSVPIWGVQAKDVSGPVAFAFSHESIHDLIYFASEQESVLTLALKQDGRLVARGDDRAIVVRTASTTQIPEEMAHAVSFFTDGVEWKAGLLSKQELLEDLSKYYDVIMMAPEKVEENASLSAEEKLGVDLQGQLELLALTNEVVVLSERTPARRRRRRRSSPDAAGVVQGDLFEELFLEQIVSDAIDRLDDEEAVLADVDFEDVVKRVVREQVKNRHVAPEYKSPSAIRV